jgi:proton-coupled amino acid transporter
MLARAIQLHSDDSKQQTTIATTKSLAHIIIILKSSSVFVCCSGDMNTERLDLLRHSDGIERPTTSPDATAATSSMDGFFHPFSPHPEEDSSVVVVVHRRQTISDWETGVSLAKAIMGAGSFALPWAFSKMGYLVGPVVLTLLLCMSVYSIQLLVQCARRYQQQHQEQQQRSNTIMSCSYVDVAQSAFGLVGARCAYVASVSASIGVCGSYLVFVAANLRSLLESYYGTDYVSNGMSLTGLIWTILPLVVLLSSVRDVKHFAFASLLGDVSVMLGMLVVLVYGLMGTKTADQKERYSWGEGTVAVGSLGDMALAFGNIGYLFLVHFLVIPIESSMERPHHFPKVATVTFSMCAIFSGVFGIIGYLMFGVHTEQIVLLNVREGSFFVTAVKVLLCVDLIFTYPVVMRPSIGILEETVVVWSRQRQHDHQKKSLGEDGDSSSNADAAVAQSHEKVNGKTHMAVCSLLGIIAASASSFVPAFGLLSGLVGGVSQTFLAFIMPPLIWAKQEQQFHQQINQQQSSIFVLFRNLPLREKALVLCGLVLILWTLHSMRMEL